MSELARINHAINLSQGIPENIFDDHWNRAVRESVADYWQYTSTSGEEQLSRYLLNDKFANCFNELIITSGCTESLFCSLYAYAQLGYDHMVTIEPYYSYYPGLAKMAHLSFTTIAMHEVDEQFHIDWKKVSEIVTSNSILLINSPHNPSGYVFTDKDWSMLTTLQEKTQCAIVIDDVYRDFNFTETPVPYEQFSRSRTLIAGSASKSYAATGARIGWLTGESHSLALAHQAHKHLSNCQPTILQKVFLRVMTDISSETIYLVQEAYRQHSLQLSDALQTSGFTIIKPKGGHFIMAKNKEIPGQNSFEKATYLTQHINITPLPLNDFYSRSQDDWLRFSFAVNNEAIATVCQRLLSIDL